MKFTLHDDNMVSRIMLNDRGACEEIIKTKLWEDSSTLSATVTINGVDVSVDAFETFVHGWIKHIENGLREKYDAHNLDKTIDAAARQLLKNEAPGALDAIDQIHNLVEEIDSVLKPHWERERDG